MRPTLFLTAALLLWGCGPRLYYPQLDWMIPLYVEDYLPLEVDQRSALEARLADQLEWHCRTQLAGYAAFLRSVGEDFAEPGRPVTRERLSGRLEAARAHWKALMARVGPDLAALVASANDEQIGALFENIEKDNRKIRRKYVDPPETEIYEKRSERMVERLEWWTGPLTGPQKEAVAEWSRAIGPVAEERLAHRLRVQEAFRERIALRKADPGFPARFTALLVSPEGLRTPGYEALVERSTSLTLDLLAQVAAALTGQQRARLLERIDSLAGDFDALSCETPAKSAP
jgi:hypothetical protein